MLVVALKRFTTLQRQHMQAEATYCLSCAEVLLTLQMNKVHERLKAVRDKRNILASVTEIMLDYRLSPLKEAGSSNSDEKLNETPTVCAYSPPSLSIH